MIVKINKGKEFYLFMNGKLLLKYWKNTGVIRIFDKLGDTIINNN